MLDLLVLGWGYAPQEGWGWQVRAGGKGAQNRKKRYTGSVPKRTGNAKEVKKEAKHD
jgi:hypothetical protein